MLVRNNRMVLYFTSDGKSMFYRTDTFANIISFVTKQIRNCAMNQKDDKLTLSFSNITTIEMMLERLKALWDYSKGGRR